MKAFHDPIHSAEDLREIVGQPGDLVVQKERLTLDTYSRRFIELSSLVFVGTANATGRCDVSPRGGPPGFTLVQDERTLVLPEVPGNRRADSLQNILENPHVGLLYVVPGWSETLRVNGRATVTRDHAILARAADQPGGRPPALGIAVEVEGCFFHCPRSFDKSGLWAPAAWPPRSAFPSLSAVIRAQVSGTC